MIEKVRIAKDLQASVEEWSQALDTTPAKFVNEAIRFYIRYLQGYVPSTLTTPQATSEEPTQPIEDGIEGIDMDW
jgi:hypothetical protein